MLITPDQNNRFWREWAAIVAKNQWQKPEAEAQRKLLLQRAGFTSLTQVDKLKGFSAVLRELAALRDDLAGMIRADDNNKRILRHSIERHCRQLGSSTDLNGFNAYLFVLMRDLFGHARLDDLTEQQLLNLRNTLAARANSKHRRLKPVSA